MFNIPYVDSYVKILKANKIAFDIINWDRLHIEDISNSYTYRDKKIGYQRDYFDYFRYAKFVLKILNKNEYEKIIIFGIQMSYFLRSYILKNYRDKYVVDFRDRNKIIKYFNIKKVIDNSEFTVISSPGYKEWLPNSKKYIINHNTQLNNLDDLKKLNFSSSKNKYCISNIGSIRDYDINRDFIDSLRNHTNIELYYHGEGEINTDIKEYLISNNIENVFLTGKYNRDEEESLYNKSDMINILVPNDEINSKTLLPNRLYNAVLYGKPIIALNGSYLAKQVSKYGLGLVINSLNEVDAQIGDFIYKFNVEEYEKGRKAFLEEVISDNNKFKLNVESFIN